MSTGIVAEDHASTPPHFPRYPIPKGPKSTRAKAPGETIVQLGQTYNPFGAYASEANAFGPVAPGAVASVGGGGTLQRLAPKPQPIPEDRYTDGTYLFLNFPHNMRDKQPNQREFAEALNERYIKFGEHITYYAESYNEKGALIRCRTADIATDLVGRCVKIRKRVLNFWKYRSGDTRKRELAGGPQSTGASTLPIIGPPRFP